MRTPQRNAHIDLEGHTFKQRIGRYRHGCTMYVDVTNLAGNDLKTGIQRVVRSIVNEFFLDSLSGYHIELVALKHDSGGFLYSNIPPAGVDARDYRRNSIEDARAGDVFLGLDLVRNSRYAQDAMRQLRRKGCRSYFIIYDLLPIHFPDYFLPGIAEEHEAWLRAVAQSDGALCISRAVADDVAEWVIQRSPERAGVFSIGSFPLGCDIEQSLPSAGLPAQFDSDLLQMEGKQVVLMVGTLEPRKGHGQVLDAFASLWTRGCDAILVIAGKHGWMVDDLVKRISGHRELSRRLFWYESISDEGLSRLYRRANGLIMASEGEGFGLPIVEAARTGLPLFLRDLPVFHEIAGRDATFFHNRSQAPTAGELGEWLDRLESGSAISSGGIRMLSWKDSARHLMQMIAGKSALGWAYQL